MDYLNKAAKNSEVEAQVVKRNTKQRCKQKEANHQGRVMGTFRATQKPHQVAHEDGTEVRKLELSLLDT